MSLNVSSVIGSDDNTHMQEQRHNSKMDVFKLLLS